MEIRLAKETDIESIMEVYAFARNFMAQNGNPTQWNTTYPEQDLIENDIKNKCFYVCIEDSQIVGVFAFIIGEDTTYKVIEGEWHSNSSYGVIHRVAGNGKAKGVTKMCFDFCKSKINHLRIDTHANNIPMQNAIAKNGFKKCGTIYVEDGSARIAFDFI